MNIFIPLAEGFEEIEAVSIIDVLRRANLKVTTVHLGKNPVKGSHDIEVKADKYIDEIIPSDFGFVVLPGGMPGSKNLMEDKRILDIVQAIYLSGGYATAICAAPIVFGRAGLLKGKKATCFPGYEEQLGGAIHSPEPVVSDGRIITGKGAGCAIPFALKLVEVICGKEVSDDLKNRLQVYWM